MRAPNYIREASYLANRLRKIAFRLRYYGIVIVLLTSVNVFVFAIIASDIFKSREMIQVSAAATLISFILLVAFDTEKRRGEIIYGEVSDTANNYINIYHNRYVNSTESVDEDNKDYEDLHMSEFEYRISIKEFANSTEMPLVPGQFGPLLFVAFNFGVMVAIILLERMGNYLR